MLRHTHRWLVPTLALAGNDLVNFDHELVLSGLSTETHNADDCLKGGIYHSNNWINAPGKTGIIISFQEREKRDAERYAIIQMFVSYEGTASYRTTIYGGMDVGRIPRKEEWEIWLPISTPRPNFTSGLGQFIDLQRSAGYITNTLPSGGVWLFWVVWEGVPPYYAVVGNNVGLVAGGTVLSDPATVSIATRMRGWAWRVL